MLSILIPIYNFNVVSLVEALHAQCLQNDIVFEILCYDDHSTNNCRKENLILQKLAFAHYRELNENLGRAKIRNLLAKDAQYPFLLFLDGDSGVENQAFISNYLEKIDSKKVLYGGRFYSSAEPASVDYLLHWKYGSKKEALAKAERIKSPYLNFQTNNFLIPKSVFDQIRFDESVQGYGYEDLLFAQQLEILAIPVIHIENEVYHLDLETTREFLRKTENAIRNLSLLHQGGKLGHTRLIKTYKRLKRLRLLRPMNYWTAINKKRLLENLYSRKPRLYYFSLLKLWLFSQYVNSQAGSFDL